MSKYIGTRSTGIKLPILKEGDNLASAVVDSVLKAARKEHLGIDHHDVIAITESIVARTDGNYATIDDIADDIQMKIGKNKSIGVVFPILSRNRFSLILKGIAKGVKKIYLQLSYPSDEVGNHLISEELFHQKHITAKALSENNFRKIFGEIKHEFTGIDYIQFYKDIIHEQGCEVEVILSNDPTAILGYVKTVVAADIHTRFITKAKLEEAGANRVILLTEILSQPKVQGQKSGYNSRYGLLGSNKADETTLKLFPEHGQELVEKIQTEILRATHKLVEVMVYGDGAFKDPQGKIWELADPVVSPFFTAGLKGTPNELKLKFLADGEFKDLKGKDLEKAIKSKIQAKEKDLVGQMVSEGTTPRQLTDLLGSLADLTSGSGDKGTPVVFIQNYFKNYSQN